MLGVSHVLTDAQDVCRIVWFGAEPAGSSAFVKALSLGWRDVHISSTLASALSLETISTRLSPVYTSNSPWRACWHAGCWACSQGFRFSRSGVGPGNLSFVPRKCWCCCSKDHTWEWRTRREEQGGTGTRRVWGGRDPRWLGLSREYRGPLGVDSRNCGQSTATSYRGKEPFP